MISLQSGSGTLACMCVLKGEEIGTMREIFDLLFLYLGIFASPLL